MHTCVYIRVCKCVYIWEKMKSAGFGYFTCRICVHGVILAADSDSGARFGPSLDLRSIWAFWPLAQKTKNAHISANSAWIGPNGLWDIRFGLSNPKNALGLKSERKSFPGYFFTKAIALPSAGPRLENFFFPKWAYRGSLGRWTRIRHWFCSISANEAAMSVFKIFQKSWKRS